MEIKKIDILNGNLLTIRLSNFQRLLVVEKLGKL